MTDLVRGQPYNINPHHGTQGWRDAVFIGPTLRGWWVFEQEARVQSEWGSSTPRVLLWHVVEPCFIREAKGLA
jgi:hypothetical protein